ncbi:RDD family protein [Jeotgalibacillus aurantiacus]|uniref:RDD family protein n=1 Tax=Jeotgalibacillus aurantiacus TaxID=2763266 RepID=UPI001D0B3985|nr:RDD family protein [Jeotgalibacillus aurantiacus]
MKDLTKKRAKAIMIDFAVSTVATLAIEQLLRRKIKNEAFHALVTPTAVMYALEIAQLKKSGQTLGYKKMGLVLQNEDGTLPTSEQLLKRVAYRDTVGTISYLKDREAFEGADGSVMPHDRFSGLVVRDK